MKIGRLRAVFFDLDDTLYRREVPFSEACVDFFGKELVSPEFADAVRSGYAHECFRHRGDEVFPASQRGEITMEEMYIYRMQKAMEDLGITISSDEALKLQELYKARQGRIHLDEVTVQILDAVKKTGMIMGVITNGQGKNQRKKFETLGLQRWIDPEQMYVSGDYGSDKPETGMFRAAEERLGLTAEEFLYIGDSYESDVCGARAAGWDVIWLNRKGEVPGREQTDDASEENKKSGRKQKVIIVVSEEELLNSLLARITQRPVTPDVMPVEEIIERMTVICRKHNVAHLKLIGSFATGTNTARSDIDFALIGCPDFEAVERETAQIETLRKIDLFDVDRIGNEFLLEDIEKYGRQIY